MIFILFFIICLILTLCVIYLGGQVKKLHRAIRKHRNQRGDDRCWLNDVELYKVLPDYNPQIETTPPPKCVFLQNCERYWASRQESFTYVELGRLPKKEFMEVCEKYWEQHNGKVEV